MTPTDTPMPAWLESAWLARYLDRQLSGEELAWFEAYLLDKPELLAMVEADNGVRDALGADAAAWSRLGAVAGAKGLKSPNRTLSRSRAGLALAASLVLGVGLGWLAQSSRIAGPDDESVIANPTRVVFDATRGSEQVPHLEHDSSLSRYILVEVAVPANAQHVLLQLPSGHALSLRQAPDGYVSFLIPGHLKDLMGPAKIHYDLEGDQIELAVKLTLDPKENTDEAR